MTSAQARRYERQWLIQAHACRLVIEHGYDGFTMDDLAQAVGVSRRTLFNLVDSKESSVLGPEDIEKLPLIEEFRRTPPAENPARDGLDFLARLLRQVESEDPLGVERHNLVERAAIADPKVRHIITERFEQATELAAQVISDRHGWPERDLRARTLAALLLSLIQLTLSEVAAMTDPPPAAEVFDRVVAAARETGVRI